jgi:hypothetical protein
MYNNHLAIRSFHPRDPLNFNKSVKRPLVDVTYLADGRPDAVRGHHRARSSLSLQFLRLVSSESTRRIDQIVARLSAGFGEGRSVVGGLHTSTMCHLFTGIPNIRFLTGSEWKSSIMILAWLPVGCWYYDEEKAIWTVEVCVLNERIH